MTEYASGAAAPELLTAVPVPIAGSYCQLRPASGRSHWVTNRAHVFGHVYVTNSSAGNVVILKARLRKYATEYAHVLTRHPEKNVFGRNAILFYRISAVIADFSFFPPIARGRETLTTDNFGDEHRVRSARFPYIGPDKPL